MKTKLFILICFLLAGKIVYPQAVYIMPESGFHTFNACCGLFYDSGGPSADYSNNESGVVTFCPSVPGQFLSVTFFYFSTDLNDHLRVYNGNDTTLLLGNISGIGMSCIIFDSSDSTNGCLTFKFISDSNSTNTGWEASFVCTPEACTFPPGTNCTNPVIIPSFPYSGCYECTRCMVNDFQSQTGICNTGYAGEDRVYQYTTTGTETVCITMSNTTANSTLAVYSGCPGVTGSICLTPIPMVGNDSMQFTFPAAGTYYIIIDEPSGFSCYDLSIIPCTVGINETGINDSENISITQSTGQIILLWNSNGKPSVIRVYDCRGRLMHSEFTRENHAVFSTVSLAEGMYFVTVNGEGKNSMTKKFVKM